MQMAIHISTHFFHSGRLATSKTLINLTLKGNMEIINVQKNGELS